MFRLPHMHQANNSLVLCKHVHVIRDFDFDRVELVGILFSVGVGICRKKLAMFKKLGLPKDQEK